jgi:hypothetical protein
MAAQAWKLYNLAKKKIGNGTINLATGVYRLSLCQSASNFATATLGIHHSVSNKVAETTDYSSSGVPVGTGVWTALSATKYKFDLTNPAVITASATAIVNIKGAIIWLSAASSANQHLVCYASLTSTQFTLAKNNTLTISFATSGVFTLV